MLCKQKRELVPTMRCWGCIRKIRLRRWKTFRLSISWHHLLKAELNRCSPFLQEVPSNLYFLPSVCCAFFLSCNLDLLVKGHWFPIPVFAPSGSPTAGTVKHLLVKFLCLRTACVKGGPLKTSYWRNVKLWGHFLQPVTTGSSSTNWKRQQGTGMGAVWLFQWMCNRSVSAGVKVFGKLMAVFTWSIAQNSLQRQGRKGSWGLVVMGFISEVTA